VRALPDDDARQAQVGVNTESSSFENPHALRTVGGGITGREVAQEADQPIRCCRPAFVPSDQDGCRRMIRFE